MAALVEPHDDGRAIELDLDLAIGDRTERRDDALDQQRRLLRELGDRIEERRHAHLPGGLGHGEVGRR